MRKVLILLLCLAMAMGCGACTGTEPGPEPGLDESVYSLGNPVDAPVEVPYLVRNPLEIVEVPIAVEPAPDDACEYEHSIIEISGLKDAEVEALVNRRIREAYDELAAKELPPYRGIKKAIPEGSVKTGDSLYAYSNANYNNILSVTLDRHWGYSVPNEDGVISTYDWEYSRYVYDRIVLNIDLNTGKDIPLSAVFGDNVDYMALVNDAVADTLAASAADDEGWHGQYLGVWLAEPFKGLGPDTKFYINEWSGPVFIVDYDTPQFYTNDFYSGSLYPDMTEELYQAMVLPYRYWDEDSDLFTATGESEKFLPQFGSSVPLLYEEKELSGVTVTTTVRCPENFPAELQDILIEWTAPDPAVLAELKRIVRNTPADAEAYAYYSTDSSGSRVGKFYNLEFSAYAGASYDTEYYWRSQESACYDAGTMEPLTLSALFTEGFDYETLFVDKLVAALNEQLSYLPDAGRLDLNLSETEMRELLLQEFRKSQGNFRVTSDSVNYTLPVRGDNSDTDQFRRLLNDLYVWLPFSEIGYENLTIF